jgi:membrane dipeptidase
MDRREFAQALLKSSCVVLLTPEGARLLTGQHESIDELYARSIVVDSLCAPFGDIEAPSADSLAAVRQSGIRAINFTISAPEFEETVFALGTVQKLVDDHPDMFQIVRRHADLARAKTERRLGLMLGFQNVEVLEQEPERIQTFQHLGVRIMQLTYNEHGKFGDGCLEASDGA